MASWRPNRPCCPLIERQILLHDDRHLHRDHRDRRGGHHDGVGDDAHDVPRELPNR